jgi:predicted AAA+ superfamily ATPase
MDASQLKIVLGEQQLEAQQIVKDNDLVVRKVSILNSAEFKSSKLVKIISGCRRTGKSTLAIQLISKNSNWIYINFDDERLFGLKVKDLDALLELALSTMPGVKRLVLDEIQNILGWELFVNRLKRQGYDLVVTGSNSRLLSSELSTHLTGRHIVAELFPFSFAEFLAFKGQSVSAERYELSDRSKLQAHFDEYLKKGAFPEVHTHSFGEPYLRMLFDTVLTRDIVARRSIRNVSAIKQLARVLLGAFSTRFTYQSLKRNLNFKSLNTVKNYVDFLEESYLIFLVLPFSHKTKERVSLPKKVYTIDTALSESVAGANAMTEGRRLENLVFLELRRRGHEIYYYLESSYEIDFVIRKGSQTTHLIQVAWSINEPDTRDREVSALLKASSKLRCRSLVILTRNETAKLKPNSSGPEIHVLPIWKWLLEH